jgi:hypothetical protein
MTQVSTTISVLVAGGACAIALSEYIVARRRAWHEIALQMLWDKADPSGPREVGASRAETD